MTTEVARKLGIEFPIFAFSHCRDVVIEVSRAGGIGVLGASRFSPTEFREQLEQIERALKGRPYGVDLVFPRRSAKLDQSATAAQLATDGTAIPPEHREFVESLRTRFNVPKSDNPPGPGEPIPPGVPNTINSQELSQELADVAADFSFSLLAVGLGHPPQDLVDSVHGRGGLVAALCGSVKHARRHAENGVDVIVAQGAEAGGHTGEIGTMVLVPDVVDAVAPLPVLAAGGIGSGRQMAASLALGAQGVWMGSAWLATEESDVDTHVKERLYRAGAEDAVVSRSLSGKRVRQLRTPWLEAWESPGAPEPLPMPLQGLLTRDVLVDASRHRVSDVLGTPVGQVIGRINEPITTAQLVAKIVEEFIDTTMAMSETMADVS